MAVKKRALIADRIQAWRMRRIVKRYERLHKAELPYITLQEEWLRCFDEYCRKYRRRNADRLLISWICKELGVDAEDVAVKRTERGYTVTVTPKIAVEMVDITVTIK